LFARSVGEIALRQVIETLGDCLDDDLLLFGRRRTRFFSAPASLFGRLDIGRDRDVHIEEHRLGERAKTRRDILAPYRLGSCGSLRPEMLEPGRDQLLGNQRISADIPSRFQADLGVSLPDRANAAEIFEAEVARTDPSPMAKLRVLCLLGAAGVGKEASDFREFANTRVK
jgi:hypothetical protein